MATRGSNAWRLEAWGEPCQFTPKAMALYEGSPRFQAHPAIAQAVERMGAVFVAYGYTVRRAGCYNCRQITGGTVMSSHAWGISIDVNDDTNPYRTDRLVTDMLDGGHGMIDAITAIRTRVSGAQVWRWGGDWDGRPDTPQSNYDAMHFEVVCTPQELAEGIDASVIPVIVPRPSVGAKRFPTLRRGSTGVPVEFLQDLLGMERLGAGAGQFGPRTEEAVKRYQRSRKLVDDGVVGLATWTAILTAQPQATDETPAPQKIGGAP